MTPGLLPGSDLDLRVLQPWMYFTVGQHEISADYLKHSHREPGSRDQAAVIAIHHRDRIGVPVAFLALVLEDGTQLAELRLSEVPDATLRQMMLMRTRLNCAAVASNGLDVRFYYRGLVSMGWLCPWPASLPAIEGEAAP